MYRAIIYTNGKMSKAVEGETPAALGVAIGAEIETDPMTGQVDLVYEVFGPTSRRMSASNETDDSEG